MKAKIRTGRGWVFRIQYYYYKNKCGYTVSVGFASSRSLSLFM